MSELNQTAEREALSKQSIVATAVALADNDGLAALSMRNLAKQLGYEVMSLYNHVANKNDLLAAMVDEVAGEIQEPPDGQDALAAIRAVAVSARGALVRHPWAAPLWQRAMPGAARIHFMEVLLRLFDHAGLSSGHRPPRFPCGDQPRRRLHPAGAGDDVELRRVR